MNIYRPRLIICCGVPHCVFCTSTIYSALSSCGSKININHNNSNNNQRNSLNTCLNNSKNVNYNGSLQVQLSEISKNLRRQRRLTLYEQCGLSQEEEFITKSSVNGNPTIEQALQTSNTIGELSSATNCVNLNLRRFTGTPYVSYLEQAQRMEGHHPPAQFLRSPQSFSCNTAHIPHTFTYSDEVNLTCDTVEMPDMSFFSTEQHDYVLPEIDENWWDHKLRQSSQYISAREGSRASLQDKKRNRRNKKERSDADFNKDSRKTEASQSVRTTLAASYEKPAGAKKKKRKRRTLEVLTAVYDRQMLYSFFPSKKHGDFKDTTRWENSFLKRGALVSAKQARTNTTKQQHEKVKKLRLESNNNGVQGSKLSVNSLAGSFLNLIVARNSAASVSVFFCTNVDNIITDVMPSFPDPVILCLGGDISASTLSLARAYMSTYWYWFVNSTCFSSTSSASMNVNQKRREKNEKRNNLIQLKDGGTRSDIYNTEKLIRNMHFYVQNTNLQRLIKVKKIRQVMLESSQTKHTSSEATNTDIPAALSPAPQSELNSNQFPKNQITSVSVKTTTSEPTPCLEEREQESDTRSDSEDNNNNNDIKLSHELLVLLQLLESLQVPLHVVARLSYSEVLGDKINHFNKSNINESSLTSSNTKNIVERINTEMTLRMLFSPPLSPAVALVSDHETFAPPLLARGRAREGAGRGPSLTNTDGVILVRNRAAAASGEFGFEIIPGRVHGPDSGAVRVRASAAMDLATWPPDLWAALTNAQKETSTGKGGVTTLRQNSQFDYLFTILRRSRLSHAAFAQLLSSHLGKDEEAKKKVQFRTQKLSFLRQRILFKLCMYLNPLYTPMHYEYTLREFMKNSHFFEKAKNKSQTKQKDLINDAQREGTNVGCKPVMSSAGLVLPVAPMGIPVELTRTFATRMIQHLHLLNNTETSTFSSESTNTTSKAVRNIEENNKKSNSNANPHLSLPLQAVFLPRSYTSGRTLIETAPGDGSGGPRRSRSVVGTQINAFPIFAHIGYAKVPSGKKADAYSVKRLPDNSWAQGFKRVWRPEEKQEATNLVSRNRDAHTHENNCTSYTKKPIKCVIEFLVPKKHIDAGLSQYIRVIPVVDSGHHKTDGTIDAAVEHRADNRVTHPVDNNPFDNENIDFVNQNVPRASSGKNAAEKSKNNSTTISSFLDADTNSEFYLDLHRLCILHAKSLTPLDSVFLHKNKENNDNFKQYSSFNKLSDKEKSKVIIDTVNRALLMFKNFKITHLNGISLEEWRRYVLRRTLKRLLLPLGVNFPLWTKQQRESFYGYHTPSMRFDYYSLRQVVSSPGLFKGAEHSRIQTIVQGAGSWGLQEEEAKNDVLSKYCSTRNNTKLPSFESIKRDNRLFFPLLSTLQLQRIRREEQQELLRCEHIDKEYRTKQLLDKNTAADITSQSGWSIIEHATSYYQIHRSLIYKVLKRVRTRCINSVFFERLRAKQQEKGWLGDDFKQNVNLQRYEGDINAPVLSFYKPLFTLLTASVTNGSIFKSFRKSLFSNFFKMENVKQKSNYNLSLEHLKVNELVTETKSYLNLLSAISVARARTIGDASALIGYAATSSDAIFTQNTREWESDVSTDEKENPEDDAVESIAADFESGDSSLKDEEGGSLSQFLISLIEDPADEFETTVKVPFMPFCGSEEGEPPKYVAPGKEQGTLRLFRKHIRIRVESSACIYNTITESSEKNNIAADTNRLKESFDYNENEENSEVRVTLDALRSIREAVIDYCVEAIHGIEELDEGSTKNISLKNTTSNVDSQFNNHPCQPETISRLYSEKKDIIMLNEDAEEHKQCTNSAHTLVSTKSLLEANFWMLSSLVPYYQLLFFVKNRSAMHAKSYAVLRGITTYTTAIEHKNGFDNKKKNNYETQEIKIENSIEDCNKSSRGVFATVSAPPFLSLSSAFDPRIFLLPSPPSFVGPRMMDIIFTSNQSACTTNMGSLSLSAALTCDIRAAGVSRSLALVTRMNVVDNEQQDVFLENPVLDEELLKQGGNSPLSIERTTSDNIEERGTCVFLDKKDTLLSFPASNYSQEPFALTTTLSVPPIGVISNDILHLQRFAPILPRHVIKVYTLPPTATTSVLRHFAGLRPLPYYTTGHTESLGVPLKKFSSENVKIRPEAGGLKKWAEELNKVISAGGLAMYAKEIILTKKTRGNVLTAAFFSEKKTEMNKNKSYYSVKDNNRLLSNAQQEQPALPLYRPPSAAQIIPHLVFSGSAEAEGTATTSAMASYVGNGIVEATSLCADASQALIGWYFMEKQANEKRGRGKSNSNEPNKSSSLIKEAMNKNNRKIPQPISKTSTISADFLSFYTTASVLSASEWKAVMSHAKKLLSQYNCLPIQSSCLYLNNYNSVLSPNLFNEEIKKKGTKNSLDIFTPPVSTALDTRYSETGRVPLRNYLTQHVSEKSKEIRSFRFNNNRKASFIETFKAVYNDYIKLYNSSYCIKGSHQHKSPFNSSDLPPISLTLSPTAQYDSAADACIRLGDAYTLQHPTSLSRLYENHCSQLNNARINATKPYILTDVRASKASGLGLLFSQYINSNLLIKRKNDINIKLNNSISPFSLKFFELSLILRRHPATYTYSSRFAGSVSGSVSSNSVFDDEEESAEASEQSSAETKSTSSGTPRGGSSDRVTRRALLSLYAYASEAESTSTLGTSLAWNSTPMGFFIRWILSGKLITDCSFGFDVSPVSFSEVLLGDEEPYGSQKTSRHSGSSKASKSEANEIRLINAAIRGNPDLIRYGFKNIAACYNNSFASFPSAGDSEKGDAGWMNAILSKKLIGGDAEGISELPKIRPYSELEITTDTEQTIMLKFLVDEVVRRSCFAAYLNFINALRAARRGSSNFVSRPVVAQKLSSGISKESAILLPSLRLKLAGVHAINLCSGMIKSPATKDERKTPLFGRGVNQEFSVQLLRRGALNSLDDCQAMILTNTASFCSNLHAISPYRSNINLRFGADLISSAVSAPFIYTGNKDSKGSDSINNNNSNDNNNNTIIKDSNIIPLNVNDAMNNKAVDFSTPVVVTAGEDPVMSQRRKGISVYNKSISSTSEDLLVVGPMSSASVSSVWDIVSNNECITRIYSFANYYFCTYISGMQFELRSENIKRDCNGPYHAVDSCEEEYQESDFMNASRVPVNPHGGTHQHPLTFGRFNSELSDNTTFFRYKALSVTNNRNTCAQQLLNAFTDSSELVSFFSKKNILDIFTLNRSSYPLYFTPFNNCLPLATPTSGVTFVADNCALEDNDDSSKASQGVIEATFPLVFGSLNLALVDTRLVEGARYIQLNKYHKEESISILNNKKKSVNKSKLSGAAQLPPDIVRYCIEGLHSRGLRAIIFTNLFAVCSALTQIEEQLLRWWWPREEECTNYLLEGSRSPTLPGRFSSKLKDFDPNKFKTSRSTKSKLKGSENDFESGNYSKKKQKYRKLFYTELFNAVKGRDEKEWDGCPSMLGSKMENSMWSVYYPEHFKSRSELLTLLIELLESSLHALLNVNKIIEKSNKKNEKRFEDSASNHINCVKTSCDNQSNELNSLCDFYDSFTNVVEDCCSVLPFSLASLLVNLQAGHSIRYNTEPMTKTEFSYTSNSINPKTFRSSNNIKGALSFYNNKNGIYRLLEEFAGFRTTAVSLQDGFEALGDGILASTLKNEKNATEELTNFGFTSFFLSTTMNFNMEVNLIALALMCRCCPFVLWSTSPFFAISRSEDANSSCCAMQESVAFSFTDLYYQLVVTLSELLCVYRQTDTVQFSLLPTPRSGVGRFNLVRVGEEEGLFSTLTSQLFTDKSCASAMDGIQGSDLCRSGKNTKINTEKMKLEPLGEALQRARSAESGIRITNSVDSTYLQSMHTLSRSSDDVIALFNYTKNIEKENVHVTETNEDVFFRRFVEDFVIGGEMFG